MSDISVLFSSDLYHYVPFDCLVCGNFLIKKSSLCKTSFRAHDLVYWESELKDCNTQLVAL